MTSASHAPSPDRSRTSARVRASRDRFARLVGGRISDAPAVLDVHGRGEAMGETHPPDLVVWPTSTDEVAAVVRLCAELGAPMIPFGAGSSLEGHIHALHGGVSIDLGRMDRILDVSPEDLDCHVEAGVTREALNQQLRDCGLFFPIDPGANATLGGMASTRASGTNAVRYGTMREATLGLTVVTPQGEVIRTGGRARKSSAGYDLTRLYVGAEGTLGVITELRMRLVGIPEAIRAGLCQFEEVRDAVEAVVEILQTGIPVARIELLDALQMSASIAWSRLSDVAPKPTLFLELHGAPATVDLQAEDLRPILEGHGGGEVRWASTVEARTHLWKARHEAYWAARGLKPGGEAYVTDACVPLSHLPEVISGAQNDAAASGLLCPILGHVGDGNFHALVLFDPAEPGERARAERLAEAIARRAIAAGGTCTGEHGVGRHKLHLLAEEHGAGALEVMAALKRALDPLGLMNPGKTVPLAPGGSV